MCGLAGLITKDIRSIPENNIAYMRDSILYRGRDDQGEWTDGKQVYFLHSRLSIIDMVTGQQPMRDSCGDYIIVFNGEIYNYRELRQSYEKLGTQFRTQSDTEVILEGFKLKGDAVCSDLNGMFAFAIWDIQNRRLFLARDRLGKKPLYWYSFGETLYFSSTLTSFGAIPGWDGRLSRSSIVVYALLGGMYGENTIYQNAYAIPPASHCFVYPGQTNVLCKKYWHFDFTVKSKDNLSSLIDNYQFILANAIDIRLRSDVPLALTFSGGVDSGTIAAICAKHLNATPTCYTIDYHTPDDPSEETINAERAARHLGLPWEHIHFDYRQDLLKDLQNAYRYYDQPSSQLPLVYSEQLYRAIKPYATVVLSGNGADELFTGYIGDEKTRQQDAILTWFRWTKPAFATILKLNWLNKRLQQHILFRKIFYMSMPPPIAFAKTLVKRAIQIDDSSDVIDSVQETLEKISDEAMSLGINSLLDLRMFLALTLTTVDANYRLPDISGLAAQVEVRSPYLDYRMIEFAARLPHRFKVAKLFSPNFNKYLPKIYYQQFVPEDIAWSKKKGMGWNLRWDKSIAQDPHFEEVFSQAYESLNQAGINDEAFRTAWNKYKVGNLQDSGIMMTGFMLGMWLSKTTTSIPQFSITR